jgi:hypothetical protein
MEGVRDDGGAVLVAREAEVEPENERHSDDIDPAAPGGATRLGVTSA